MPTPIDPAVRQAAFAQCVQALRRTLATTPLGWVLIFWVCHGQVALAALLTWLAVFVVCWSAGLATLLAIHRAGSDPARHALALLAVAALDGVGWGAMGPLLMGGDAILNAWLSAILCGVAAVNAPVYLTWFAAFGAQTFSMWLLALLGQLLHPDRPAGLQGMVGLTVFVVVIASYLRPIAARIVDGIRLQFANADLTGQLRGALEASQREAETDALTGLPNRRALAEVLQAQLHGASQQRTGFAVLMLDLDHFKNINDGHGHAVGDQVLQAFAARVRETLRDGDVCARHGGEEFVVVLPGATLEVALAVAERLRAGIAASPLPSTPPLAVTVSIGAAAHQSGEGMQDLLSRADTAVYEAKRAGRNRVCAAKPGSSAA